MILEQILFSNTRLNVSKHVQLAKFFMSKGDFLPIEFRNPTRAFEELKVIFQLAAKRGPSSNLWNFWRQGDTDQFEVYVLIINELGRIIVLINFLPPDPTSYHMTTGDI